jgi:hypothetical protein
MIRTLRDLAAGLMVLGFLLILPTVAAAHSQPPASDARAGLARTAAAIP